MSHFRASPAARLQTTLGNWNNARHPGASPGKDTPMQVGHSTPKSFAVLALTALASVACGFPEQNLDAAAGDPDALPGYVALVPQVEVDGLDRLAERSSGNVFLEEVLLHSVNVRATTLDGRTHRVSGGDRFYLRYNPAAGEAGLTRLWVPASSDLDRLVLQVQPDMRTAEQLGVESRDRGMDLTDLSGASVVIRGVVAVTAGNAWAAKNSSRQALQGGEGCVAGSCDNTVPDTAPATGGPGNVKAEGGNGTVPDTAPANGETAAGATGYTDGLAPGVAPRREYRKFTVVTDARFLLQARVDPEALSHGGTVHLHLDANALFSDANLALLQRTPRVGSVPVTSAITADDLTRATRFEMNEVPMMAPVAPR